VVDNRGVTVVTFGMKLVRMRMPIRDIEYSFIEVFPRQGILVFIKTTVGVNGNFVSFC